MFIKVKERDLSYAVYWDGSPAKADALVARSTYVISPAVTYTAGVLDVAGYGPVLGGYWIVWPEGLESSTVEVISSADFAVRYEITGPTL